MMDYTGYTLEQIYEVAESVGDSRKDVDTSDLDEVCFGHEYTEMWVGSFESFDEPSYAYEHLVWED